MGASSLVELSKPLRAKLACQLIWRAGPHHDDDDASDVLSPTAKAQQTSCIAIDLVGVTVKGQSGGHD